MKLKLDIGTKTRRVAALLFAGSVVLGLSGGLALGSLTSTPAARPDVSAAPPGPSAAPKESIRIGAEQILYSDVQKPPAKATIVKTPKAALPTVGSLSELMRLLRSMGMVLMDERAPVNEGEAYLTYDAPAALTPMYGDAPEVAKSFAEADRDAGGGFSQTNSQVQGVEEGDIVKTDGRFLYIAQGTRVSVVEATGANMSLFSVFTLNERYTNGIAEMYVSGDRLIVVTGRYEEAPAPEDERTAPGEKKLMYRRPGKSYTSYVVYDISDKGSPFVFREFEVEGNALATRLVGDVLYFAASKWMNTVYFNDAVESDLLPMVRDTAVGEEATVAPVEKIQYIPDSTEANYLFVGGFDITNTEPCEMQTILGAGSYFYMSASSMYIVRPRWGGEGQGSSDIYRFGVDGVYVSFEAQGVAPGQPLNQYSMDEYGGYFRFASTDWGRGNYVTVFDADLKEVGRTPPLAADETIQSVRFMGDVGYVVTFRQMDPLFALDLSDPTHPRVLGQLKIPGFSTYLHPMGDGLLVGIGRHTQETYVRNDDGSEEVVGVRDAGLKVSLFDVSDPANPLEIGILKLGNGYTDAEYNPRALMADAARGILAFPVQMNNWGADGANAENWQGGLVLAVEDRALTVKAELKETNESYAEYGRRFCYIEDTLYLVNASSAVDAYDYETFAHKGRLALAQPQSAVVEGDGMVRY